MATRTSITSSVRANQWKKRPAATSAVVALVAAGRFFHWFARTLLVMLVLVAIATWATPEPRLEQLHNWGADKWHELQRVKFRLR